MEFVMRVSLLTFAAIAISAIANAQQPTVIHPDPTFSARLDELSAQRDLGPLFQFVNAPRTSEQYRASLDWLQLRVLYKDERDPRYFYSYAQLLHSAKLFDTAAYAYLGGILFGQIEATRCADSTAANPKILSFERQFKALDRDYWSMPPEKRKQALNLILTLEVSKPLGAPSSWLCSGGMRDTTIALEKARAEKSTSGISERIVNGRKEIVVDTSQIEPAYLSDGQAAEMRKAVRLQFQKYYSGENPNPAVEGTLRDEAAQRPSP